MLRAGDLRHRITIQQSTVAADQAESWSDVATVWAGKRDVGAREALRSGQVQAVGDTIFTIRWRAGLTAKMRISYGGEIWQIAGLSEIAPKVGWEILARRRQD